MGTDGGDAADQRPRAASWRRPSDVGTSCSTYAASAAAPRAIRGLAAGGSGRRGVIAHGKRDRSTGWSFRWWIEWGSVMQRREAARKTPRESSKQAQHYAGRTHAHTLIPTIDTTPQAVSHPLRTMKVFFSVAVLLLCLQAALGFVPAAPKARCQVTKMAAAPENKALEAAKKGKQALAGLMTPLLLAAPALATEGTGEAFGVDDSRIPLVVGTIGAAFAFLFSSWSNKQDNDEFFNGYQDTERK